ncbi:MULTISPECIES: histidine phosphatase family protein [unclassified Mesorhizobium]|uniref:histidine phosphatase family protein n=1 Tax=unclassified Mesorhizobium TaxID=325217 RepID=UPI001FCDA713|nr:MULTISPECIES: histidine phosphatase family protein [unclassified Mesorhizobium]
MMATQFTRADSMIVRLTMICSGATEATRRTRFPIDEPLEAAAIARTAGLAHTVDRIDRLWVGPSLRARQTARALAADAIIKEELRDQDFGEWSGQSAAVIQEAQPRLMTAWRSDPHMSPQGGESFADVNRRISPLMDELIALRGHTVAVTHAAIVRAAIVHVLGAPLSVFSSIDVEPLSMADFRSDGQRWMLRGCGITVPKQRPVGDNG